MAISRPVSSVGHSATSYFLSSPPATHSPPCMKQDVPVDLAGGDLVEEDCVIGIIAPRRRQRGQQ